MKNPVTFSITEARKVQKKRQIRQIILLCAIILFILGGVLIIKVSTMKQQADQLFPSEISPPGTTPEYTDVSSVTGGDETSAAVETTAEVTVAVEETTAPAGTEESSADPDATSGGTDTSEEMTTEIISAPALTPEVDVFIPDRNALQTTTHKVRDSAFHELQKSVQALIDGQTGVRCGFYYINLKNGEQFGYNDMIPFVAGSAINLPINMMLYEQIKEGSVSLTELMTLEAADLVAGTGTIQNTVVGSQHYIRELSGLSITNADNTATSMLLRRLGGIDTLNNSLKLISNVVDFRTPATYTDYANVQQTGMNRTSTQDLAKYMAHFYEMYLSYPAEYQPLFNDLAHTASDWGVAANLSSDILVCHKTGSDVTFGSQTDVALIFAEEPYIICVTAESADQASGKLLQQQLGDLVYAYLHGCYS